MPVYASRAPNGTAVQGGATDVNLNKGLSFREIADATRQSSAPDTGQMRQHCLAVAGQTFHSPIAILGLRDNPVMIRGLWYTGAFLTNSPRKDTLHGRQDWNRENDTRQAELL